MSPFRAGTLVALTDGVTQDFGTMSRHEGDPVIHEHQFYRTSFKGMFSVDLASIGVFSYENRTGFLNLDAVRREEAQQEELTHDEAAKTYRLPPEKRRERIAALLHAMAKVDGGAKQALHYADVSPVVVVAGITKGGNNPFYYTVDGDREGFARPVLEAFREAAEVWGNTLLSPLYVGWVEGYAPGHRATLLSALGLEASRVMEGAASGENTGPDLGEQTPNTKAGSPRGEQGNQEEKRQQPLTELYPHGIVFHHPRRIFERIAADLKAHPEWIA